MLSGATPNEFEFFCIYMIMITEPSVANKPNFISAMLQPEFYKHSVQSCELIETHISWVILTGDYVYKVKKSVDFGFLDFSSLEKRKFFCEEELRLNQRLAPDLYLDVVTISGTSTNPILEGGGEAFEYAVKMRQFSPDMQLDHMLARDELQPAMIDSIAELVAGFHQQVESAGDESEYGDPEHVLMPVKENFSQIRDRVKDQDSLKLLSELEQWSDSAFEKVTNSLIQRKENGYVRECHGDLHLRNLAWYKNKPLAFDCLEFNPNFRWIDVISEIAFFVMDLHDHERPDLAQRFLNRYLESTGDYIGCSVLRFYLVYRAMVRAKVDAIRTHQEGITKIEMDMANKEFHGYLKLAQTYTKQDKPYIIITRGKSASGKSTLTQPLLEKLGAIRIRSDVERKRMYGIKLDEDSHADREQGIYTPKATDNTYLKLLELTGFVIDAGISVIVDATFTKVEQRNLFRKLATEKKLNFVILEFIASDKILRQRIRERKDDVSDADLNVLESQIKNWSSLDSDEQDYLITINTEEVFDIEQLMSQIINSFKKPN